jgi:hypothetical protein
MADFTDDGMTFDPLTAAGSDDSTYVNMTGPDLIAARKAEINRNRGHIPQTLIAEDAGMRAQDADEFNLQYAEALRKAKTEFQEVRLAAYNNVQNKIAKFNTMKAQRAAKKAETARAAEIAKPQA